MGEQAPKKKRRTKKERARDLVKIVADELLLRFAFGKLENVLTIEEIVSVFERKLRT